jgi:hypothetical protein
VPEQLSLIFDGPLALLTIDEIYASASAELLVQLNEDRRIERKPPGYHPDALGEYFSMWANTSPEGGIIVVGQHDKGPLLGCSGLPQHDLNRLEKTAMDYCPDAKNVSKRIESYFGFTTVQIESSRLCREGPLLESATQRKGYPITRCGNWRLIRGRLSLSLSLVR